MLDEQSAFLFRYGQARVPSYRPCEPQMTLIYLTRAISLRFLLPHYLDQVAARHSSRCMYLSSGSTKLFRLFLQLPRTAPRLGRNDPWNLSRGITENKKRNSCMRLRLVDSNGGSQCVPCQWNHTPTYSGEFERFTSRLCRILCFLQGPDISCNQP